MSKHGIIGRVTQLSRANVDATVDLAEQPQLLLDQLVRDYSVTIADASQAIAQLVGNLHIAEDDQQQDATAIVQWGQQAAATSEQADELRATGDAAAADRFDALARVALARQITAENDVESVQHTIDAQIESVEALDTGIDQLRIKLSELTQRRDSVAGQSRSRAGSRSAQQPAPARRQHHGERTDILDPASEVARFEDQVRCEQAMLRGAPDGPASAPDAQFASPADRGDQAEIDERLKALKTGRAMASALARAHDQPLR